MIERLAATLRKRGVSAQVVAHDTHGVVVDMLHPVTGVRYFMRTVQDVECLDAEMSEAARAAA